MGQQNLFLKSAEEYCENQVSRSHPKDHSSVIESDIEVTTDLTWGLERVSSTMCQAPALSVFAQNWEERAFS